MDNPSLEGLLDPGQLEFLGSHCLWLEKLKEAIDKRNQMIVDSGLPIRLIETFPLGLQRNDISKLAFSHDLAEKRIRAAALDAVERIAA